MGRTVVWGVLGEWVACKRDCVRVSVRLGMHLVATCDKTWLYVVLLRYAQAGTDGVDLDDPAVSRRQAAKVCEDVWEWGFWDFVSYVWIMMQRVA